MYALHRKSVQAIFLIFALMTAGISSCFAQSIWDDILTELEEVHKGKSELYLPLHTWHNRATYTAEQIASYNENPLGIGYGKVIHDERHNWRGIFAMAFMDSHHKVEPLLGYGHTWNMASAGDWNLGFGYAAVISLRQDIENYHLPILGASPLLSVGSDRFSVLITYMPRVLNRHGDVAFFVGKMAL